MRYEITLTPDNFNYQGCILFLGKYREIGSVLLSYSTDATHWPQRATRPWHAITFGMNFETPEACAEGIIEAYYRPANGNSGARYDLSHATCFN